MTKLKFETPDLTSQNIDRIAALFPNCVTEMRGEDGKLKRGINFELLKQMLSPDVVDGDECYEFTWVGKKASIVEANKPIRKTLRPCPEESKNWDTTENLYIEGDNLEVLKLLQESYLGKVKMIYIDPPYNTGNDFIYADDFMRSQEEENEQMGMYDEDDNRLFKNTDTNGRFHSDWCSMMYSRLMLARNLLSEDGAIFISIDDNEQDSLKRICDEVFGSGNFIGNIVWKRKRGRDNSARWLSKAHEYCLLYSKQKGCFEIGLLPLDDETKKAYRNPDNDSRGVYRMLGCWARGTQGGVKYSFTTKDGQYFSERLWLFSKENLEKLDKENKLIIRGDNIYRKMFITENKGKIPETLWDDVSNAANAADEIKGLFGEIIFDTPKPIPYIKRMLEIVPNKDSIILDFFSGSATTAQAVMAQNFQDVFDGKPGKRKFIMVQLPEPCDEKSEAYKAGYKNICEIGKERIRRAGELEYKNVFSTAGSSLRWNEEEKAKQGDKYVCPDDVDIGFRVLKLDDSNMKDVYYAADEYDQGSLADMVSNIKEDRTDLDLLFGCLLDWGLPLSLPYQSEQIDGCTVHTYNDGDLIACFDPNVPESVVKEIAKRKPLRAVFRDSSFANSPAKINVFEIFKLYMPEDADDISKRIRVI